MPTKQLKPADEAGLLFFRALQCIHATSNGSFWYRVADAPQDDPSITNDPLQKELLKQLNGTSLRERLGLRPEEYISLLIGCGLAREQSNGVRLKKKAWKDLMEPGNLGLGNGFEFIQPKRGARQTWYIKLGPDAHNATNPNVTHQLDEELRRPRLGDKFATIQRGLRYALRGEPAEKEADPEKGCASNGGGKATLDPVEQPRVPGAAANAVKASPYPSLSFHKIDVEKLEDESIKTLIGELVREQRCRAEKRKRDEEEEVRRAAAPAAPPNTAGGTAEAETAPAAPTRATRGEAKRTPTLFEFCSGETEYTAVPIPRHKDDGAHQAYLWRKDYIKEIVEEMGKSSTADESKPEEGAKRLLNWLMKHHPKVFMEVAKRDHGVGMLDDISLAALALDCDMKDWQVHNMLKHLRHGLGGKVSVPFRHTMKFRQGYVRPKTKKFTHHYENGDVAIIKCYYQNVADMAAKGIGELLTQNGINPSKVKDIDFILGGDHGIGAFRLCFRVVVTLTNGKRHYWVEGAGAVFGKDTPDVLENSIMPWLTEDLKTINDSKLVIQPAKDDGTVVVSFLPEDSDVEADCCVIDNTTIWNTGDLKWMAMLLGMNGMSGQHCLWCLLRKEGWTGVHAKGTERTIEFNVGMAGKGLKGVARAGVKTKPYWDFIPIENYVVPLLHLMIGLFNDIDEHMVDTIDGTIIAVSEREAALRQDLPTVERSIEEEERSIKDWTKQHDKGVKRSDLMKQKSRLEKLFAQGDTTQTLTPEQMTELQSLNEKYAAVTKKRDQLKQRRKNINDSLAAYRAARKRDPGSVHNKVERLMREAGLDRGAAFGGKYNGKVARSAMERPEKIYNGVRTLLKQQDRSEEGTDECVDTLCDALIDVMKSWNDFFSLLQSKAPTNEDRARARGVAKKAVKAHYDLLQNMTPKCHVAEDHAVDQYLRVRPGLMCLLIEHWVEKNHQDGHQIEKNAQHLQDIELFAQS